MIYAVEFLVMQREIQRLKLPVILGGDDEDIDDDGGGGGNDDHYGRDHDI